jgi:hypothetical protein
MSHKNRAMWIVSKKVTFSSSLAERPGRADRACRSGQMAHYLDPLPKPKPGGRPNLLADWDGLSQETQLLILDELRQDPGPAEGVAVSGRDGITARKGRVRREVRKSSPLKRNVFHTMLKGMARLVCVYVFPLLNVWGPMTMPHLHTRRPCRSAVTAWPASW